MVALTDCEDVRHGQIFPSLYSATDAASPTCDQIVSVCSSVNALSGSTNSIIFTPQSRFDDGGVQSVLYALSPQIFAGLFPQLPLRYLQSPASLLPATKGSLKIAAFRSRCRSSAGTGNALGRFVLL